MKKPNRTVPTASRERPRLAPMRALGDGAVKARQHLRDEAADLRSLARQRPSVRLGIDAIRKRRLRHIEGRAAD